MSTLNATTTGNEALTADKVTAFADAKKRLAARMGQLLALKARAQKIGATKSVMAIDADLKEANSLRARIASIDAMLAPFLKGWEWAKGVIGLNELGAFFVPVVVVGAITTLIYAINVFDKKIETTADRHRADIEAVEAWKKQGMTDDQAFNQVNKTNDQRHDENLAPKEKKGLFGELEGLLKFGVTVAAIGGGLWWWSKQSEQKHARN